MEMISESLVSLKKCIPCEFNRKPRPITECKRWKATEFRQFVLYVGPVVLQHVLKKDLLANFLCLHSAIFILSSKKLILALRSYAQSLLVYFVETFAAIYGKANVSHNVHNLLHICKDTEYFGTLSEYSAFLFENYMQSILKLLRKKDRPLEQIVCRKTESAQVTGNVSKKAASARFSINYSDGPILRPNCTQYKQACFNDFTLKLDDANNCCCLKNGTIISIKNFVKQDNVEYVIGTAYINLRNLYLIPCPSSELGIYVVNNEDVSQLQEWYADDVEFQCIKLLTNNNDVAIFPLVHLI